MVTQHLSNSLSKDSVGFVVGPTSVDFVRVFKPFAIFKLYLIGDETLEFTFNNFILYPDGCGAETSCQPPW